MLMAGRCISVDEIASARRATSRPAMTGGRPAIAVAGAQARRVGVGGAAGECQARLRELDGVWLGAGRGSAGCAQQAS